MYSLSVSLMSADGDHSTVTPPSPSRARRGLPPSRGIIRLNRFSTSANGSQRTRLMAILPCDCYDDVPGGTIKYLRTAPADVIRSFTYQVHLRCPAQFQVTAAFPAASGRIADPDVGAVPPQLHSVVTGCRDGDSSAARNGGRFPVGCRDAAVATLGCRSRRPASASTPAHLGSYLRGSMAPRRALSAPAEMPIISDSGADHAG